MNICLIGDGLISLTLAKALVNNKFNVSLYSKNIKNKISENRTIGISSNNFDFLKEEIIKINKNLYWEIKEIEILNEDNYDNKIINFKKNNQTLFNIIKNKNLYNLLFQTLKTKKNFKKKIINNKFFYQKIIKKNTYDLIINCDSNNEISKKYFFRKFFKNYKSIAYIAEIQHEKINNKKATQIFTKLGPIAFLPISDTKTSVVYSIKNKSLNNNLILSQKNFEELILLQNKKYKIKFISKFNNFNLKSQSLRNYFYGNILAFGDFLHQIHPLSGQGFNMTLRDIKIFLSLIKERLNIGVPLDSSLLSDFEKKTKHLNFLFSSGNDLIYEFFNYDNVYLKPFRKKMFNLLNNNNYISKLAIKYADQGFIL